MTVDVTRKSVLEMMTESDERSLERRLKQLAERLQRLAENTQRDVERGMSPRMIVNETANYLESCARDAREVEVLATRAEARREVLTMLAEDVAAIEVEAQ